MKKVKRLAREFQPEHYDIYLALNKEAMSFSGKVVIRGKRIGRPSQRLTFHQKDLKITSARVTKNDKKKGYVDIEIIRINRHKSLDEVRLHAAELIYPGDYEIELQFSGRISENMHGIYPANFKLKDRDDKLIATQFESHHAREAFPCVDEPEAKATFDLSLLTPKDETVIANTPVKSQSEKDGQLLSVFETTPRMSTYLLAFAFGKMIYKEGRTKNGVVVRSYGTPLAEGLLDYSVEAGARCVEFFEDYFGVAYPLPKLDMLALPDFSSGAMENWGLITYRESVMLVDPQNTGIETKQICYTVVAHEVSHQWFGNLVTMKWWDDLWLNESFADLMEYRAVDEIMPEWNIFEQFVNLETNAAMRRDALPNVQPVRVSVNHPDEINSLFDPSIVYAKGGNILRMLMSYVGEEAFRKGLSEYFRRHAYGNTEASDLWAALSASSGKDIDAFMDKWLNLPGYPVVDADYEAGSDKLALSQKRLVIGKDSNETIWPVPLASNLALDNPTFESESAERKVTSTSDKTLLLNHDGQSYYIPHYTNQKHRKALTESLEKSEIGAIDRLLLLLHGSILESAGVVGTVENLELAGALAGEREEAVWSAIAGVIGSARRLMEVDDELEPGLNTFIQELVGEAVEFVGWDAKKDESAQTKRLRNLILGMAAGAQSPKVIDKAKKLFADFSQPFDLPADIRGTVYFVGARFGGDKDFSKLINLYKKTDNADEKDEISSNLTSTRDPAQLDELIRMIKTDVRAQDVPRWFVWLMRNKYSTDKAWQWLNDNWGWIEKLYGDDKSFDYFPRYAAIAFSKPEQLTAYKKFFEPKRSDPALTRVIDLGIEEIEGRIEWRDKNEAGLRTWLRANF
ncbi:MAG TPA: M1 family metallopeptidase [Candidatus Saccharimonadales bacterium]|nr:M1 family metallopeptidase [Candidatus Saccharimonadales bacterium]